MKIKWNDIDCNISKCTLHNALTKPKQTNTHSLTYSGIDSLLFVCSVSFLTISLFFSLNLHNINRFSLLTSNNEFVVVKLVHVPWLYAICTNSQLTVVVDEENFHIIFLVSFCFFPIRLHSYCNVCNRQKNIHVMLWMPAAHQRPYILGHQQMTIVMDPASLLIRMYTLNE